MSKKIAFVTGGTGGIGTAICERLATKGYSVATNYRNADRAGDWAEKEKEKGFEFLLVKGDVTDPKSCEEMARETESKLGAVDILVNNAGITRDTTFHKMSADQWKAVIDANLNSCFNMSRPVIEGMRKKGFGRIIQISSINGQKGQYGQANYAASKSGMHGFTMALAQESAQFGITVNTVSPGYVATEMVMAVPEEVREKIVAQIPMRRLGTPEDVAYAVTFLVSDEASFITGANLSVNGGHYMGW